MNQKHEKPTAPLFKILVVFATFLMMSCAASMHPGMATITKPAMYENTEAIWFNYWQDQFDAFKGNVIAPTAEYPEAAKQAYQRASSDWQEKVQDAANKSFLTELGIAFAVPVVIGLIIYNSIAP